MFSLWRKARRENSAASRLLGSTSLRFALHGWQRMNSHWSRQSRHVLLRTSAKAQGTPMTTPRIFGGIKLRT
ncbi:hypothetical protein [Thiolapillus sp.]|uniref:hypothetical protein n=1 Tax=Thiolapillus sp. TaxID=2017437 RepID=UPI003AF864C9